MVSVSKTNCFSIKTVSDGNSTTSVSKTKLRPFREGGLSSHNAFHHFCVLCILVNFHWSLEKSNLHEESTSHFSPCIFEKKILLFHIPEREVGQY